MIDERNFFDQPTKKDQRTYDNIRKIATYQGDDYTDGCLLDYSYFKEHYKTIAIDLSKQQELDAHPKAKQQINFTRNVDRAEKETIIFFIDKAKETILNFPEGTVKVLI